MPNITPNLGKGLGRKKDKLDDRDRIVPKTRIGMHLGINAPLPSSTDVFAGLNLTVYDQGELGSCTANAGVLYRRFLAQRFAKYSAPDEDLSRLFLYYQERKLPWNNDTETDSGAAIRDIFYVLAHTGVCPAGDDPYDVANFASVDRNDTAADRNAALPYRIGAYHRVPDVSTALQCLASGYAVLLGITVYPEIEDVSSDGVLRMPAAGERPIGGHAVVIRGYNDHLTCFYVQNSWSAGWGDHGCFWLPYEYVTRAEISEPDMWMGHLGKPWS